MESITERAQVLRRKVAEYRGLLAGKLDDPTTMYLGDNYFASMPLSECRAFLTRRIETLESELSTLDQLAGVGEDGLPIFDIVEELDDNGQILHSNLKRTGLGADLDNSANDRETPSSHISDIKRPISDEHKAVEPLPDADGEAMLSNGKTMATSISLPEGEPHSEFEHIETSPPYPADEDDDVQYIEDVNDSATPVRAAEDTSQGEYRDIDPADVLELELLDDSDEENVNFDFDNIEEDDELNEHHLDGNGSDESDDTNDETDEDDESYAFGWQRGSLFPQDEATRKLIEAHLAQKDQLPSTDSASSKSTSASASVSSPGKSSSQMHVHFADTVDVREFETTPSERKVSLFGPKPSRFRFGRQQARTVAPSLSPHAAASVMSPTTSAPAAKTRSAAAAAAAAAGAAAGAAGNSPARHGPAQVHGAVREKGVPATHVASPPSRRASIPPASKPQANTSPSPSKTATQKPSRQSPVRQQQQQQQQQQQPKRDHLQQTAQPPSPEKPSKDQGNSASKVMAPKTMPTHEPAPLAASKRDKLAERANEYYEESFIPDVEFLKLHDTGEDTPQRNEANGNDGESTTVKTAAKENHAAPVDRPIVSSQVLEREPTAFVDTANDSSDDNTPDMREIKHEYQRLRQHLIYESGGFKKKDSEKAIEPIEEDGAPKKVSRFKAARVAS